VHTATIPAPHHTTLTRTLRKVHGAFGPHTQGNKRTCLLITSPYLFRGHNTKPRQHHYTLYHRLHALHNTTSTNIHTTTHSKQYLHYSHLATVHSSHPTTNTLTTHHSPSHATPYCTPTLNPLPIPSSRRHYVEGCGTCGLAMRSLARSAAARPSCGVRGSCTSDTSRWVTSSPRDVSGSTWSVVNELPWLINRLLRMWSNYCHTYTFSPTPRITSTNSP